MSTGRLLIIGFGAFPRVPRNPSAAVAQRVADSPRLRLALGTVPRCLVLRTTYAALGSDLAEALADRPDAVLMIGVSMRTKHIRVEGRARNRATRLFPDAEGRTPSRMVLEPLGPAQRASRQAGPALVVLRRHGVTVKGSRDAGAYLCNASYFHVLAQGSPAVFLHIPRPPDPGRRSRRGQSAPRRPLVQWTEAFADIALLLLAHARRDRSAHMGAFARDDGLFRPGDGRGQE